MKPAATVFAITFIAAAAACTVLVVKRIEGPREYMHSIQQKRRQTDQFMAQSPDSPFPSEQRATFGGLSYFPPDPAYRVQARLIPISGEEEVVVPTSDGSLRRYQRYAWAEFDLQGARQRLLLLKDRESSISNSLFLAFRDQSSGAATYGGGRYLDLYQQREEEITIDFNLAYNPYCVYNLTYSCPLPPRENYLTIPIPAGERMYPPQP